jgi:hypothetical protein
MKVRIALVAALLIPAPAAASIIEATFTGLATVIYVPQFGSPQNGVANVPFTADLIYDTTMGTLQNNGSSHRLDGGLVRGTALFDGFQFAANGWPPGSFITRQDDLSSITANAGSGFQQIKISTTDPSFFQTGTCPGGICGQFTRLDSVNLTIDGVAVGVPGPAVGAGLPGLLAAACGGIVGLARRRRKEACA